jgi:hypothetical protein
VRQLGLDAPRRLDERDAVAVVLLDAGRDREDVGSNTMSSGGKPTTFVSKSYERLQIDTLRSTVSA